MTTTHQLSELSISGRRIGRAYPPYVIAELSANHLGKLSHAMEILEMAVAMGADAVKLQTYRADTITIDHDGPGFRIEGGLWHGRTLYDLYEEAHMPWEWHAPLMERGRALGVAVFSSPFDFTAVDYLANLNVPAYKIASFEATDLPLIDKTAAQEKPLIVSTGMANLAEITEAYEHAEKCGAGVALLHCISGYPTPIGEANLLTIPDLAQRFPDAVIGLSDHTLGTVAATAAIACGAAIIEKHVTMRRSDGGPDSAFSLEPDELRKLIGDCRAAWEALGRPSEELQSSESGNIVFRRSLYAVADIAAGETLTHANIRSIRPGYGLPPKRLPDVLGCRAARAIRRGEPMSDDMIA